MRKAGQDFSVKVMDHIRGKIEELQEETDEIFQFLEKRKVFLEGVVITGGEPTLQTDLLL